MKWFSVVQVIDPGSLPKTADNQGTITHILNIVFVVLGSMAILLLVIAAINYVTSGGNPERVSNAKNRITYTLIGLIIVALAASIVNFALKQV